MRLLIQFPTKQRPERFKEYLYRYVYYLEDKTRCRIAVSCDIDDLTMNNDSMCNFIHGFKNVGIFFNYNKNKIQAINAQIPSNGWDVLLLASDDMWPMEQGFDNIIRSEMSKNFPDTDGVLHFNDSIHGDKLNTLAIVGNKYYNRFKYIYNPKYKSLYADNEFGDVSKQLGKSKYIDRVIIKHMRKEVPNDTVYKHNHSFVKRDKRTYEQFKKDYII